MSGTLSIPETPTLHGDTFAGPRAGHPVGPWTNAARDTGLASESGLARAPQALAGPASAATGTGITADMLQKLLRLGAPLSFITTLLHSDNANAPGLPPEELQRNIAAEGQRLRGDPRDESTQRGAGSGAGMQIANYDNLGTYARAAQLAKLTGVPAFTFQGKLYRPGDTRAPVSAAPQGAPQMRVPGGMPQEAGPRQAPHMDLRPESGPPPQAQAPAQPSYAANTDFNVRGGGNA